MVAHEQLVYDILLVDLFKNPGSDHGVQIGLHVLESQVDVDVVVGFQNIGQPTYRTTTCSPSVLSTVRMGSEKRSADLTMFSWLAISCRNMISRNVRWASVAF